MLAMGGDGGDRWRRLMPWRRGPEGLVPIGWAIGGMLTLALVTAAGVIAVLFAVGQFQGFQKAPLTASSLYDLLKIGFAFAAGIAGVVALVTAYRRQRVAEFAHDLAARAERSGETGRLFNERFATAAGQLGDDRPAVRLAGVYAMAGLADDGPSNGRSASMSCAPFCACRTSQIPATTCPEQTGRYSGRPGKSATPSSGSSPTTCSQMTVELTVRKTGVA